MSLSRVKSWTPGEILTAADLNAEFNNLIDNPTSLISPSTAGINFNLQAHTNMPITAMSASSGATNDSIVISSGVPTWQTIVRHIEVPLNPDSAQFPTVRFASASMSTDLLFPVLQLVYTKAADGEHAYFYRSLTSAISQVSSAALEFFYTATSSGANTVWQVNTRTVMSGSTWDVIGVNIITSAITYDSTAGGLKLVSVPLTATSWSAPAVLQVSLKRVSSDVGDTSNADANIHTAAIRIKV